MKKPVFLSKSGIYIIICSANLKFYIGSSYFLMGRYRAHKCDLNANNHDSDHMQAAWNKYGADCFIFGALEYCEPDKLIDREQYYLDKFKPYDRKIGFNTQPFAGSARGVVPTDQAREKHRMAKKITKEKRREQQLEIKGVSFQIVSPEGQFLEVRGINKFAQQHGLNASSLCCLLKRKRKVISMKGWYLPEGYIENKVRDKNGKLYIIPPGKMRDFCKDHDLHFPSFQGLLSGSDIESVLGWTKVV